MSQIRQNAFISVSLPSADTLSQMCIKNAINQIKINVSYQTSTHSCSTYYVAENYGISKYHQKA